MGIQNRAVLELDVARKKLEAEKKKAATAKRKQQKSQAALRGLKGKRTQLDAHGLDTPLPGTPASLHPDVRLPHQEVSQAQILHTASRLTVSLPCQGYAAFWTPPMDSRHEWQDTTV